MARKRSSGARRRGLGVALGAVVAIFSYLAGIASAPAVPAFLPKADGVYFTRAGEHPERAVIGLIDGAEKTLDVAVYSLTHDGIVQAIRRAKARGVAVRVITDAEQVQGKAQNAAVRALLSDGIPVKVNEHSGLMHLKLAIADGRRASVGSFNFTKAASTQNDEIVVLLSDPEAVRHMAREFDRLWNDREAFRPFRP
ncbi:phospholipase D-like domain-containing protein [Hydrogenibacillus sp. N12]|uniref:phospholipase D-like domain-containing protein n=1 Tax=Hydrogenibacillus sp. N12 TaxID=2866627 RepID=UPI001C7E0CA7|nr:phospholipase D-like domain-containing protein [Hydrogenibacillus sp. N12]QZA32199.1 phospholipase D family protein [Hydrogenibacillus sp. N12]